MKKIGLIVAVEIQAVIKKYGEMLEAVVIKNYKVNRYRTEKFELYVLNCGAGQIAASAGTQFLISRFDVDLIVNFGVVGGLTSEMTVTKTCIIESVVHYDFDTSAADGCEVGRYLNYPEVKIPLNRGLIEQAVKMQPDLKRVVCASGDKFIADQEHKQFLHDTFGAHIVEMEAAGIVLTCDKNGVPCILIKTVSDSITGGAEEFRREINRSAEICLNVLDKILSSNI